MPNKNVLAIVSALAAVALTGLAIYLGGDPLAIIGAGAGAVGYGLWGSSPLASSRRGTLVMMAVSATSAALFFHFDSFWGLFVAVLSLVWASFGLLPFMDGAW